MTKGKKKVLQGMYEHCPGMLGVLCSFASPDRYRERETGRRISRKGAKAQGSLHYEEGLRKASFRIG